MTKFVEQLTDEADYPSMLGKLKTKFSIFCVLHLSEQRRGRILFQLEEIKLNC